MRARLRGAIHQGLQIASRASMSPSLRRAGLYVASALISALIPFLLLPVLARALGPEGYGLVGAFTGLVTIATVLVGLNTHAILVTIFYRVDAEEFARAVAACLCVALTSAPILWGLSVAAGPWIRGATHIPPQWYWALAGAGLGQFFLSVSLSIAQVRGNAPQFATLQISNSALNLLLTIGLVVGLAWDWSGRALAQCVATMLVGLLGVWWVSEHRRISLRTTTQAVKQALKFGVPLVPHSLAAAFIGSADRLVLISLGGAASAGQYFAAFQVAGVTSLTALAINQAMTPWLFRSLANRSEEGDRRIVRVSYLIMAGLIVQGILVALLAEPLMYLAGGSAFVEAAPLVRVLTISTTLSGCYYIFTNYIFHAHKTHWLSAITLAVSLFQVALALVLVRLFGPMGAAWGSVATNALYLSGVWIVAARLVPMPWFRLRGAQ